MLRVLVELVRNVVSTLQMLRRRPPVIGTQAMPVDLPGAKSDTNQETNPVAARDNDPTALILKSAAKLRVSKNEGALTARTTSTESLGLVPRISVSSVSGIPAHRSARPDECRDPGQNSRLVSR